ncbi:MAG: outer membrane lipoprotein carrier protein LolA [Leptospiraceae bacterium]|nr:outer membrane lipoprotein carrier protein LolA [Leptospiraceae bacterium]MCB1305874.1 outer membrane lipoprotein carrier protein LolA [Leptospiraceae bacterium]
MRRFAKLAPLYLLIVVALGAEPYDRLSHAEVARKLMDHYEKIENYQASFTIRGKGGRTMTGTAYYQSPAKLSFDFNNPAGNRIVSDGKTLWIKIARLNAVGKQDLTLKPKDDDRDIFSVAPGPGLKRLFSRYHYKFDNENQPREVDGKNCYILDLDQREKVGGFEHIVLYVDKDKFLVYKAEATDGNGDTTTITLTNIRTDVQLEGKVFQFQPDDNDQVVNNPLVE